MSEVEGEGAVGSGGGEANGMEMLWERIALERREGEGGGGKRGSKRRVE